MEIKKAEFVRSISRGGEYFNPGLPEIAVVGKSNVGKSSLINMLTNNRKLARVSNSPERPALFNIFSFEQCVLSGGPAGIWLCPGF